MAVKKNITRSQEFSDSVIDAIREPLIVLDHDLRVVNASRSFYKFFKVKPEETVGQLIYDLGNKQWDIPKLRELLETILPEKATFDDYEVEHNFATIGRRIMLLNARQIQRESGKERIILLAIEDITERKQLEELLLESEERYRRLFETASDGIVLLEKSEGKITHANPATEKMLGYNKKESIGHKLQDIGISLDMGDFQTTMQNLNKSGISNYDDVPVITKSGQHIDTDIYLTDRARLVQCNIRDITERKQTEELIRQREEKYRTILENIEEGYYEVDLSGNFTFFNDSMCRILGYPKEELMGMNNRKITDKENAKIVFKACNKVYKTGEPTKEFDWQIIGKAGIKKYIEQSVSLKKDSSGKPTGFRGIMKDITERKKTESQREAALELLRESEERYKALFNRSLDLVYVIDFEGRFIDANAAALNRLGYTREEIHSLNYASLLRDDQLPLALKVIREIQVTGIQKDLMEFKLRHKNGSDVYVETHGSVIMSHGKPVAILSIARDITERRRAEEILRKTEETYRLVVDNIADVITVIDLNLRFTYVSPSIIRLRGYTAEEVMAQTFEQIMTPESLQIVATVFEEEMILEASGTEDPDRIRILELEEYRKDGSTVWLESHLTSFRDKENKLAGIIALNHDITERRKAEAKLQQTLYSLKNAVGATIQVMVSAVEMKDPYTAGHQLRSADLACAIATEMGLTQEKIDGIHMAGSIHDIGKLSIPAEILSKPTKLTNIEFSLIKEHVLSGYEMLKDVESPWPLAQIVYQHHERMDGSGYPRNLKGDEIIIEARIMAVADVVEAMASHRPYRPSLGIDATLEEIEKNRGILYDAAVADACLRLFRGKGFQLK
jgi:PAS domain S-box-containing protein